MKQRRIGLFGGSFDPPHKGHQALVFAALAKLNLDAVFVIPVGVAVHRSLSEQVTAVQRFDWMQRIFSGDDRVEVLDWEVASSTPTPSIATLRRFACEYPQARPVLLLGADAFAKMDAWIEYPEHARLCDVVVFERVGSAPVSVPDVFKPVALDDWRDLAAKPAETGYCVRVNTALPDISATDIRQRAQAGAGLAGLVPECVRLEIEQGYI